MRHRVAHRKLGRTSEHRKALLRNLCTSLIVHERLITTLPKAKELRPFAERVITLGKRALTSDAPEAALHARRLAAAYFYTGNRNRTPDGGYKRPQAPRTAGILALDKLFDEIAARFADRPGGYTRILKLGARKGDGAEMALIELVGSEHKATKEEEKPQEKKKTRRFFGRGKKADAGEGGEQKADAKGSDAKKSAAKKPAAKKSAAKKASSKSTGAAKGGASKGGASKAGDKKGKAAAPKTVRQKKTGSE
ncbi:MAG TPA: 50S ribosomal protein L17 [Blastocatellia bacterium]|nr:50S ribosomal protein L17 [Blastocatellia bacterium]